MLIICLSVSILAYSIHSYNWNAHSVCNKRPEIESLLHLHDLDILGVTESLLRPGDVWELPGFMSYRADRLEGQGGGVLILVKREFRV